MTSEAFEILQNTLADNSFEKSKLTLNLDHNIHYIYRVRCARIKSCLDCPFLDKNARKCHLHTQPYTNRIQYDILRNKFPELFI